MAPSVVSEGLDDDSKTPTSTVPESVRSSHTGPAAMERQATGGLWGWWTGTNKPPEGSAEAFIAMLGDV